MMIRAVWLPALGCLLVGAAVAGPWRSHEIYAPPVEIGNVYDGAAGRFKYNHCATVAWYRDRWFVLWNANTVPIEGEPSQPIVLSTSRDFKTWSAPVEPFNDPAHCQNPVKLATGRQWQPGLVVVGGELWCLWCQSPGGDAGCYFSRLRDPDGKWENRRLEFGDQTVIDGVRYDRLFPSQNPCVLASGRVLAPLTIRGPRMEAAVATDPWRKERKRDTVLYTDDNGATWHLSPGATIPGMEWACWEPTVWESDDGLVRMLGRNNNWADIPDGGDVATRMMTRSLSRDAGATWTPHEFLPIETVCSRAHVLALPGGRFAMVMNDWRKGRFASDRQNLALFFNRGGGWDFTPGIRVSGADTRVAYPQMFVKDDAVHIAYTRQGTPASIRYARVSPLPSPERHYLFPRSNTAPSSVPVAEGKSLRFDEHQRLDTAWTKRNGLTDLTIGMWIRATRTGVLMDARKPGTGGALFQIRPTKEGATLCAFLSTPDRDIESALIVPSGEWCYVGLGIDNRAGVAHFVLNDRTEAKPFAAPAPLAGETARFGCKRFDKSSCPGFVGDIRWAGIFDNRRLSQEEHRALFNGLAAESGHAPLAGAAPAPKPDFALDPATPDWTPGIRPAGNGEMRAVILESDGRPCLRFNGEASAGVDLDRNRPAEGDVVEFEFAFKIGEPPTAKEQIVLCTTGGGDRPLRVVVDGGTPGLIQTRIDGRLTPAGPFAPSDWTRLRLRIGRESCEVAIGDARPTRVALPTSETWISLGQGYLENRVDARQAFIADLRTIRSRVLRP